jgi:uncharacterized protein YhaN
MKKMIITLFLFSVVQAADNSAATSKSSAGGIVAEQKQTSQALGDMSKALGMQPTGDVKKIVGEIQKVMTRKKQLDSWFNHLAVQLGFKSGRVQFHDLMANIGRSKTAETDLAAKLHESEEYIKTIQKNLDRTVQLLGLNVPPTNDLSGAITQGIYQLQQKTAQLEKITAQLQKEHAFDFAIVEGCMKVLGVADPNTIVAAIEELQKRAAFVPVSTASKGGAPKKEMKRHGVAKK